MIIALWCKYTVVGHLYVVYITLLSHKQMVIDLIHCVVGGAN